MLAPSSHPMTSATATLLRMEPECTARRGGAGRCKGCRRILFRHELPLAYVVALLGRLEVKCGCNVVNVLGS
jgi:hypothetical protein